MGSVWQPGRGKCLKTDTLRGKAYGAHYTQGVLSKPLLGRSYAADELSFDILPAAERVNDISVPVHSYGVHGEIAACKVIGYISGKPHLVGTAVVGVLSVYPICGYLIGHIAADNGDGAVFDACGYDSVAAEGFHYLLGKGICGYIGVVYLSAHYPVADAAAYHIGFIAILFKHRQYLVGILIEFQYSCLLSVMNNGLLLA